MGTNYYLRTGRKIKKMCNLGCVHTLPEEFHIGKSSFGRYFTLHEMTTEDGTTLDSLTAWQTFFRKFSHPVIVDEYGDRIPAKEMWNIITRKDWEPAPLSKQIFKKSLIGTPVKKTTVQQYPWYDEWGERGFVKTHGAKTGSDGLYILMTGEFS